MPKIKGIKPVRDPHDYVTVVPDDSGNGYIRINSPRGYILTRTQALSLANTIVDTVERSEEADA